MRLGMRWWEQEGINMVGASEVVVEEAAAEKDEGE